MALPRKACHGEHLHGRTDPGKPPCLHPRGRGLGAGPFPYNESRHPGGPSHSQGSLMLPHKHGGPTATWLPCWPAPCCSHGRECPASRPKGGPSPEAEASLRLGSVPRNAGNGRAAGPCCQTGLAPAFRLRWPPVRPPAVRRGAIRWGQSTAAGPGPGVPLPRGHGRLLGAQRSRYGRALVLLGAKVGIGLPRP